MSIKIKYIGPFYRVESEGHTFVREEQREVDKALAERLLRNRDFSEVSSTVVPVHFDDDNI